jgi:hypothetical protein
MIPAPHLHLIINHIPLLGMLYGAFLLVVYFFRQNLGSVLLIALGLILISALFSVPTFYSGEWAEDIVENQSHVSETFIHEHEESAEITVWFLAAAGLLTVFECLLSLLSIYFKNGTLVKRLSILTLLTSVIAIGLTARTANLGGKISHPELRDAIEADKKINSDHTNSETEHE